MNSGVPQNRRVSGHCKVNWGIGAVLSYNKLADSTTQGHEDRGLEGHPGLETGLEDI